MKRPTDAQFDLKVAPKVAFTRSVIESFDGRAGLPFFKSLGIQKFFIERVPVPTSPCQPESLVHLTSNHQ